jgi:hypothetical protein
MKLISEWTLNCKYKKQRLTFCQILKNSKQNLIKSCHKILENSHKTFAKTIIYLIVLVPLCSSYVASMYVRITMKCFGTDSALTENDCFAEHSLFFSSSYTKDQLNPPKHTRPIASHLKKKSL